MDKQVNKRQKKNDFVHTVNIIPAEFNKNKKAVKVQTGEKKRVSVFSKAINFIKKLFSFWKKKTTPIKSKGGKLRHRKGFQNKFRKNKSKHYSRARLKHKRKMIESSKRKNRSE